MPLPRFLMQLVSAKQIRVIAEVAQKPIQLPECFAQCNTITQKAVALQTAEARARQNEGTEKVSGDPTDRTQHERERGTGLREDFR
jgi:hypothetical protein